MERAAEVEILTAGGPPTAGLTVLVADSTESCTLSTPRICKTGA
jgi:hypothetical protein